MHTIQINFLIRSKWVGFKISNVFFLGNSYAIITKRFYGFFFDYLEKSMSSFDFLEKFIWDVLC